MDIHYCTFRAKLIFGSFSVQNIENGLGIFDLENERWIWIGVRNGQTVWFEYPVLDTSPEMVYNRIHSNFETRILDGSRISVLDTGPEMNIFDSGWLWVPGVQVTGNL
ncbi:uncharacterized protein OCT59_014785 [Rhizophagus irregularis]|uniref:uncharacterized protein n=1 Tax=Rhizophagus irregularis TaxID=588596 RepID=UPI003329D3B3|nr:hypothetical protein OCT59_014785 [Rhizophagus irregularis]